MAAVATGAAAVIVIPAIPAGAASVSYAATSWTVSQVGTVITVQTAFTASMPITADNAGVCARNGGGGLVDFPFTTGLPLRSAPVRVTAVKVLDPGNYTMWACVETAGYWHDVGAKHTVVVADPAATRTYPTPVINPKPASPSGEAMPVGDLPGWRQVFTDDFITAVPPGSFPGPYASKWHTYDGFRDTSGNGMYNQKMISVHDGAMDVNLRSINGVPQGAAQLPITSGGWAGQTYGRYTIRYRSDWLPGYGAGWLLWPDSNNWNDGEIDFPEGGLAGTMTAHNHCIGHAADNCLVVDSGVTFISWHTATIEWTKAGVFFFLDGRKIGADTTNIPSKPMHWVLQTATSGKLPSAAANGHVLIDWVAIYAPSPGAGSTTTTTTATTTARPPAPASSTSSVINSPPTTIEMLATSSSVSTVPTARR